MADYKRIVQAVAYLAAKSGSTGLNRLHAFKLLYLADRDYLRRCGSTITGDTYNAMKYGPVPVAAEHLFKARNASSSALNYASKFIKQKPLGGRKSAIVCIGIDKGELPARAIESLETAWKAYADHPDIIEYTHCFPEWQRAMKRKSSGASSVPMRFDDFFLAAPKAVEYCNADPEWVKSSREVYNETSWIGSL